MTAAMLPKMVGTLGRLGSDHAGERAAAGLIATRLLRDAGATWEGLLSAPAPAAARAPERRPGPSTAARMSADARWALQHLGSLAPQEVDFLLGLTRRHRPPSAKQADWLKRIAARLHRAA